MKQILRILSILIFSILLSSAYSHASIVNYTNDNSVLCLTVHEGSLWSGTKGGIVKWNLKDFSYTKIGTDAKLPHMRVTCIRFDKKGNMWIGTHMGVVRYDKKKWVFYGVKNGLPGTHIKDIYIDKKNTPWVSTKNGVAHFNGYWWVKGLAKQTYGIKETSNGFFYSCGRGGVIAVKNNSIEKTYKFPNVFFNSIAVGKYETLWLGTLNSGIFSFSGKTWKRYGESNGIPSSQIKNIFIDSKNRPWAATAMGVSFFEKGIWNNLNNIENSSLTNDKPIGYKKAPPQSNVFSNALVDNYTLAVAEDSDGNIYIGTPRGISKYDGEKVVNMLTKTNLGEKHIVDAAAGRKNTLWFFPENGNWTTLKHVNLFMRDSYEYKAPLFNTIVKVLAKDHDGSSWFGTKKGVVHLDENALKRFGVKDGLPSEAVSSIFLEKEHLWFGTGNGVVRISRNWSKKTLFLKGLYISDIEKDVDGNMWFATLNGAYMFNGEGWKHFGFRSGLPDDRVFSITCEKDGIMWFATMGGLTKHSKNGYKTYSKGMGLANEEIRDVVVDKKNRKWVTTSLGVSCIDDRLEFDRMGYTGLGARVLLRLTDPALNKRRDKRESIKVNIKNILLNTVSSFRFLETGKDSGEFLPSNGKKMGFALQNTSGSIPVKSGYTNFLRAFYIQPQTGEEVYAKAFWEDVVSKGNLDGNALVDRHDAAIARAVRKGYMTYTLLPGADVNGDGKIGIEEEKYAIAVNSGKINPFKKSKSKGTAERALTFPPKNLPWDVWRVSAKNGASIKLDKLYIEIPPKALSEDKVIEIYQGERTPSPNKPELLPIGKGYNFYPVNLHFKKPIRIAIKYTKEDLKLWGVENENGLKLGFWNVNKYELLPSKVNIKEREVEGVLDFFPDSLSRPNRAPFAPLRTVPISNILTHSNYFTVMAVAEESPTSSKELGSIAIVPKVQVFLPAKTKRYRAIGIDRNGRKIKNFKAHWSIEKKDDIDINQDGSLKSQSEGIFYLKASHGNISKKTIGFIGNCSWCHYFGK